MRRLLRDIIRAAGWFGCRPSCSPNATAILVAIRYDRPLDALGGAERAVVATSISIAKETGRILRDAGMHETIDAIVGATAAVRSPATVVTGDASHIQDLACCVPHDVGAIQLNDLAV